MLEKEMLDILDRIDMFKYAYDIVRIVDPIKREVVRFKNKNTDASVMKCFDFWAKNKVCDNCISMKAYHENKTLVKLDNNINSSYLLMAIPYDLDEKRIVFELFKDLSDSFVLESGDEYLNSDLHHVIEDLNHLLMKDVLTDVFNRRYILEKLPVDIINTNQSNQQLSVIMFDIDYLKEINDTYGHQAGDLVIKGCAMCASACLENTTDWVARYGGEEFLVCLPGSDRKKAYEIADRIRMTIENNEFTYKDTIIKLTASFGISVLKPSYSVTMEKLIEVADQNLYKAKQNGRNRVVETEL